MAADALDAYHADTKAGRDALLVCDTTEMARALNERLHHDRIERDAPTVAGMGGQRIGVGDLIISRRNDPTIDFHHSSPNVDSLAAVRNGNRWRVAALDAAKNLLAAERLDDSARVVFDGEYLREHVGLGYAVTVHSAQGVTADASHAVLGETTSRALLCVAMTRGRATNTAHLYQRNTEGHEYGHQEPDGIHVKTRGDSRDAAALVHGILTNHDQHAVTAHDYATRTPAAALPERVRQLVERRAAAAERRHSAYQELRGASASLAAEMAKGREQVTERGLSVDDGIEL
jgi:hypothetical protein